MSADPRSAVPPHWTVAPMTVPAIPRVGEEIALGEEWIGTVARVQYYIDPKDPRRSEIYVYLETM